MTTQRRALLAVVLVLILVLMLLKNIYSSVRFTSTGASSPDAAFNSVPGGSDTFGLGAYGESAQIAQKAMISDSIVPVPPIDPGYNAGSSPELIPADRMIIKTATLAVVVDDVSVAVEAVAAYALQNGGYEVTRNLYKNGLALEGSITVRIPSKIFDSGVGEIKKLGKVQSQQVNGQDVTEEFVDVAAQLKNLHATEDQFLQIMKQAQKIEDILSVQRELTNVRSQIERLEGRKKYLEQSASLSTITVNFATDPSRLPVVEDQNTWKPLAVVKDAMRDVVAVGRSIVEALIRFVVYAPIWLGVVLFVWIVRRLLRRKTKTNI